MAQKQSDRQADGYTYTHRLVCEFIFSEKRAQMVIANEARRSALPCCVTVLNDDDD